MTYRIEGIEEKIICAAIWYKELPTQTFLPKNIKKGIVVCGHRHAHCIDVVSKLSGLRSVSCNKPDCTRNNIQGFLTNTNRFVDREEAYSIAKKQNQINNRSLREGTLFSEDLY